MGSRMNTHELQTRGCGGKGLVYGSSTPHLTGLKGFAANALVPDTAGRLPKVCRAGAFVGQSCFGSNSKDGRVGHNVLAQLHCTVHAADTVGRKDA